MTLEERLKAMNPNNPILPKNEGDQPAAQVQEQASVQSDPNVRTNYMPSEEKVYLVSSFSGLGGFFGLTQRRFKFKDRKLTTNREDADYILKHHSNMVHEVADVDGV